MAEFYRNHIYLAMNRDDLDVDYMGMEQMDGNEYANVRINDEITLNLYIDPETNLPMITTYEQFDPQQGQTVTVRMVANDWRETGGVMMPYEMTGYAGDEQRSKTEVTSHTVQ